MSKDLVTIPYDSPKDELLEILNKGFVAIVKDREGKFLGLVTRMDFINYIRYEQKK
jgi:CBS domain-containing protein